MSLCFGALYLPRDETRGRRKRDRKGEEEEKRREEGRGGRKAGVVSITCGGEGSLIIVGHGRKVTVGESLLLDVVQLVHSLLARHKLADRCTDHCGAYVIIVATRTPFFWGDHLRGERQWQ